MLLLGPTSKYVPVGSTTPNAKSDSTQNKTILPPVANVSKNDASSIPASNTVPRQESKSLLIWLKKI